MSTLDPVSDISVLKIRVYTGGFGSTHSGSIKKSIRKIVRAENDFLVAKGITQIDVQYMGSEAVAKSRWTLDEYIDWLAEGHIYFIVAHPVQGIPRRNMGVTTSLDYVGASDRDAPWDLSVLAETLQRKLGPLIGYPQRLNCGAFTQDKLVYKHILQAADLCSPYFELSRTTDGVLSPDVKRSLFKFCANNIELPRVFAKPENGKARIGWVIKSPFTTHSMGRIFCYSVYQLLTAFRRLCQRPTLAGVPVFFVEPRYGNRMELKTVFGEDDVAGVKLAPYLAKNHISSGPDFKPFRGGHDIFAFAQSVKQVLINSGNCEYAPILRVDTFETERLTLVVNEIESLEANTQYSGVVQPNGRRGNANNEAALAALRDTFWDNKVLQLLKSAVTRYF
jgi:hypothetical protein